MGWVGGLWAVELCSFHLVPHQGPPSTPSVKNKSTVRPTGSGHPRAWGWEVRGINLAPRGPRPTRPEIPGLAGTRLPDHKRSRLLRPWCPHPPPPGDTQGIPAAGAPARSQRRSLPPPRSVGQEGRESGPKRPGGRRPQRSRFQASEGRPGRAGGAGGSSLPAAAASLPCALLAQRRPVPKNNVSLPGGPAAKGGGGDRPGAAVLVPAGCRASSGRVEMAYRFQRAGRPPSPQGPHGSAPRSPTPTRCQAGPGRAHVGRGSGPGGPGPGFGPWGQGAGAAAQGGRSRPGWRRMRGEGVGGPGRARTWRLYLQSPSVRAAEPHAAAQT